MYKENPEGLLSEAEDTCTHAAAGAELSQTLGLIISQGRLGSTLREPGGQARTGVSLGKGPLSCSLPIWSIHRRYSRINKLLSL